LRSSTTNFPEKGISGNLLVLHPAGEFTEIARATPVTSCRMPNRLVHNAHRIEMRGESMRRKRNPPREENDEKKE
jgi:hypothetical protein